MYFHGRGCVRPLRHLYGHATCRERLGAYRLRTHSCLVDEMAVDYGVEARATQI